MPTPPAGPARPAGLHRIEFTMMISMMMASTALSIDLMLPAFGAMRADLGLPADSSQIGVVVTAFFLGFAVFQLLFGPIADRFGRKVTLYAGLVLYVGGALASALAPSLGWLVAARLVWGIGSASPRVVSLSVVRDLFAGEAMARAMSFIMAVFVLVPVFAPSLGAAILRLGSWRLLFVVVAAAGVGLGLWTLRLPETLDPAHRLPFAPRDILDAARTVMTTRVTIGYTVAMAFAFGAFMSYLSTTQLIVSVVYDRGAIFPLVFGGTALLMGAMMLANAWFVRRLGMARVVRTALGAFVALSGALALLAASHGGIPPFGAFVLLLAATLGAYSLLLPNLNALAMEPMGDIAGMAAAIIGAVSTTGAAVLGFLLDRTFDGTVLPFSAGFLLYGVTALAIAAWAGRRRVAAAVA